MGNAEIESVAVFLDAPNFYRCSKDHDVAVELDDVIQIARGFGRLVVASAYLAMKDGMPADYLARRHSQAGFEVKFVPPTYSSKDVDTTMVADIVQASYELNVDAFVIVSGDADFVPAIEIARRRGKRVVLIAYQQNCSQALRSRADSFVPLPLVNSLAPIRTAPT